MPAGTSSPESPPRAAATSSSRSLAPEQVNHRVQPRLVPAPARFHLAPEQVNHRVHPLLLLALEQLD